MSDKAVKKSSDKPKPSDSSGTKSADSYQFNREAAEAYLLVSRRGETVEDNIVATGGRSITTMVTV